LVWKDIKKLLLASNLEIIFMIFKSIKQASATLRKPGITQQDILSSANIITNNAR